VDFTNSFFDTGCLTFVTAKPKQYHSPSAFVWPFDIVTWLGLALSCIIFVVFSYALVNLGQFSFLRQLQYLVYTLLEQQSSLLIRQRGSIRVFFSFWLLFTLVMVNVYRSKLVTLMAFPLFRNVPDSFEELVYSDYQIGFLKDGDAAYNTLAGSTDPVYIKLVEEMNVFTNYELACLRNVIHYEYGCIAYDFALRHLRERNLSDSGIRKLRFAPATTYNIWIGIGTPGKSIYRKNFGKWLSYARQFHLAEVWERMDMNENVRKLKLEWWRQTNQTKKESHIEDEHDDKPVTLTLKHTMGVFQIAFAFLLLSLLVFIYEVVSLKIKVKE